MSAAAVGAVGLAARGLTQFVPLPHISIVFLAAVLAAATFWGFWPSVFAAALSVMAGAFFFYSPIFDFRVADAQDVADLAVFVIVAAFTSRLAADVRARALEAQRRQQNVSTLLEFSERLAASETEGELHAAVLEHLAAVLGQPLHLFVVREECLVPSGTLGAEAPPPEVRQAVDDAIRGADAKLAGWRIERLASAQGTVGAVAVRAPGAEMDEEYVRALLGQAALGIERARLRREIGEARLRAQGEALREALINSVSHDLQTPLAAILGSATALESFGAHGDARARAELAATIRGEAERLTSYIENVLDLTRIRAGPIAARLELIELPDIVNAALRRKGTALERHALHVHLPSDLPMLQLDLFLMEHALANVLDNAAKFAPPGSRIDIAARMDNGVVLLEVTDRGSGIRDEDRTRVFDAFYRGAAASGVSASGSGLGLAICRAFVEANGGSVSALSAGHDRGGTTLRLALPVPKHATLGEHGLADE